MAASSPDGGCTSAAGWGGSTSAAGWGGNGAEYGRAWASTGCRSGARLRGKRAANADRRESSGADGCGLAAGWGGKGAGNCNGPESCPDCGRRCPAAGGAIRPPTASSARVTCSDTFARVVAT